jgi:hypothetical protein
MKISPFYFVSVGRINGRRNGVVFGKMKSAERLAILFKTFTGNPLGLKAVRSPD